MGVQEGIKPDIDVEIWRESFLSLIHNDSPVAAVGAIGLGTESVVKFIYKDLIASIEKYSALPLESYVFFPLHTEVDDEHGLILLDIARQMSEESEEAKRDLRKGMLKALNLRAAFWDAMYERAKRLNTSNSN
jgi:pyrroloquinoline quinone (PQQ) biosynthesis protein C